MALLNIPASCNIPTIVLFVSILTGFAEESCPIWRVYNSSSGSCSCGEDLAGIVDCVSSPAQVSVLYCYCMTFNNMVGDFTVAQCPYNCYFAMSAKCTEKNAVEYTNISFSNNIKLCSRLHRVGHLCGDCARGYGPPIYSYSYRCVKCDISDFKQNLLKYFTFIYLPLTGFYILVILMKVSITSPHLVAFVFTCQILTIPSLLSIIVSVHKRLIYTDIAVAITSLWNLDFLRIFYPPFCLHPRLTSMHVLAMEYIVALYPMMLIAVTLLAVNLHDRYPLVVSTWRPVVKVLRCLRRQWDIQGSLVQAFATFFTLTYVKILNVSFELLNSVTPVDPQGNYINTSYIYNIGTIKYFSNEHLPFALLALVMITIFNILPVVVLLFYPYSWFRKYLMCGRYNPTLHILIESFNGFYKSSPRYCQSFAALFFISRFIQLGLFSKYRDVSYTYYSTFHSLLLSMAVILLQPYKMKIWNRVNFAILVNTSFVYLTMGYFVYSRTFVPKFRGNHTLYNILEFSSIMPLLIYFIIVVVMGIVPFKILSCIPRKIFPQYFNKEHAPLLSHD